MVFCRYYDKNWVELLPPVESVVFPEYTVHCCKRSEARFMSVSEETFDAVNEMVPVLDRSAVKPKYTLTFCLAPVYGKGSNWLLLAELVEHYKLQGVEHFYFYFKDIDEYSRELVESYVRSGEVETVFLREEHDRAGNEWQIAGVQDCLHRNRDYSRYSIFADLDERIMALGNSTLADYVLAVMNAEANVALLKFTARFILRTSKLPSTYEGEQTLIEHLPTLVFHNTTSFSSTHSSCKSIVDCRRVLAMGVHKSKSLFPGYKEAMASTDKALIMHYRSIDGGQFRTRSLPILATFGPFQMTYYPAHLMSQLYSNVMRRLSLVYGYRARRN
ncbi:hypothetical protein ANCCAN_19359 [Ancylostoma caninum]|uniref:Glycosyltransferase family 92 protein n=1 Tax=Ancylostoma caninum TaxID=29170 RepID=A0A368FVG2_ANCCA|nr:hypothetical protein ANCCAN_19359 [Ancylostoma caninum]